LSVAGRTGVGGGTHREEGWRSGRIDIMSVIGDIAG
jgi:hypothetical protein